MPFHSQKHARFVNLNRCVERNKDKLPKAMIREKAQVDV